MLLFGLNIVFLIIVFISTPVFAHSGERGKVVIHMIEEGFEPETASIEKGETVIYENVDTEPHWPASNIHPTHRLYPGSDIEKCTTVEEKQIFDACRGIEPGESWSFVFEKPGEWRYHDHLNPKLGGRILLEGDEVSKSSEKLTDTLEGLIFFVRRLYFRLFPRKLEAKLESVNMLAVAKNEDELSYWLRILGGEKVMDALLEDAGGGSLIDCHTQAHQTGRLAYDIYGAKIFSEGDASCHSGFYHGGMEAFLAGEGTTGLAEKIKNLCSVFATSFGNFECLHGVGHGVMAYEDYDMQEALGVCDELGDQFSKTSCYGGVFMENIVTGQGIGASPSHKTEWVSDDPHFPCNALAHDYDREFQCYQMQTSWMLTLYNYDFERVANECLNSPEDMKSVCFKSLGRDAAGHTLRDPEKIIDLCDKVPSQADYYEQCVIGAVNVIVDFWGEALEEQPFELCKMVEEEKAKEGCYSMLSFRLIDVFGEDQDKIKRLCSKAESQYETTCLSYIQ